jgi:dynein heavy chain 2
MKSSSGEVVPLLQAVQITERVEEWLSKLSNEMKHTLKELLVRCVEVNDIRAFPSQILCVAEQIHFTQNCERALQSKKLPALAEELKKSLATYTSYEPGNDNITRLKLKALVLDIIHNMDVVDFLIKENGTIDSWAWQKQLRFYLDEARVCKGKMSDATFTYTYEYQGNAPKLVHTPLTDKCYLTLTQGIDNGYGGNPYGPAGTGKTESVKALGQLLGRQVLVFNCDEGIDFKSMGRIFTGIVKCGAWGCFDEFNRLDEEVLSAVSQQIQVIQSALKNKEASLVLLNSTIDVDSNSGIFVTLNPAGKGYGGRSKLPDNLKQLFRSVAMSAPDLEQISEVILYSEGFMSAKQIGSKLVNAFSLCKQLLSPQQHYDWGLRALKTILNSGGGILLNEKRAGKKIDYEAECRALVQALRINTLSKLTWADSKRFNALCEDVWPGLQVTDVSYAELEASIGVTFFLKLKILIL